MHLVDISMFLAPEGGGVGRYLDVKHAWLARHTRWRHTIVAPAPGTLSGEGRRLYRSPLRVRHGYRFPLCHRAWARRIAALRPDLIEAGDPYVLAWSALDAAQQRGVPAVGFYHSDVVSTAALRFGGSVQAATRRYARALYSRFDLVLAPSRYTTERLRGFGIEQALCQPLGVDVDVFNPARADVSLRSRLGLAAGTRLLVFAGRFAREKNIDVLLDMIARLGAPYHLLLVGSGRAPAATPNVTVLPYERDPHALAAIMAGCDAFVHAGDRETFGLVALEAMACALPVVTARGGAVSELVERTGIVADRASAEALAQGVDALFAAGPQLAGHRARRWVEQHYTWDIVLRSLLSHYTRLLGVQATDAAQAYAAR